MSDLGERGRPASRTRAPGRSALVALGSSELGAVLEQLLRSSPSLCAAAEHIARDQLGGAKQEGTTEEVEWELRSMSSDELNGRAGPPAVGITSPRAALIAR